MLDLTFTPLLQYFNILYLDSSIFQNQIFKCGAVWTQKAHQSLMLCTASSKKQKRILISHFLVRT
jgi:hypothetical protein